MRSERFYYGGVIVLVAFAYTFFAATAKTTTTPKGEVLSANITRTAADIARNGKTLVFSDEFADAALSNKNWAYCYNWKKPTEQGCTNQGNLEQQWYTKDNLKVANGVLTITAQRQTLDVAAQNQVKTFDYTSGMINSGRGSTDGSVKWAGTYGYYEAKIKFGAGQGVWPAFWLLPVDKSWPPEIDIMEFVGSKPKEIVQTVHWKDAANAQKSEAAAVATSAYSNGWHTYAVHWRPDRIDWLIDDEITRTYTGPNIPDKPMEIIINLAIGGLLPGNADKTTPLPSTLNVDYVRVYQSPDQNTPRKF